MMLASGLAPVGRRGGVLAQRMLDDRGRHLLELAARPHRVELHLASALEIIEAVIGLRPTVLARPPARP